MQARWCWWCGYRWSRQCVPRVMRRTTHLWSQSVKEWTMPSFCLSWLSRTWCTSAAAARRKTALWCPILHNSTPWIDHGSLDPFSAWINFVLWDGWTGPSDPLWLFGVLCQDYFCRQYNRRCFYTPARSYFLYLQRRDTLMSSSTWQSYYVRPACPTRLAYKGCWFLVRLQLKWWHIDHDNQNLASDDCKF